MPEICRVQWAVAFSLHQSSQRGKKNAEGEMSKAIQYSIRWTLSILAFLLVALFAESAAAELRTYVKEYAYRASKADGKESSQTIALREVKKLLLEALATDLESITEARRLQLTKDQIAVLSAGIVKMEVEDERWDDRIYWLKVRIAADPGEVIKRIDALRKDQEKAKELEKIRMLSDDLFRENERLRKELVAAKGKKRLSVKAAYDKQIKEIRAVDWYEKGFASINLGMYDQAIRDLSMAMELNPKDVGPYYNRGLAYTKLRQHTQAIQDYSRAIELDPKFEAAYIQRGFAFFSLGQHDQAIEDFNRTIKLNPKLAVAYNGRGIANANRGNFDEAIRDYNKAIEFASRFVAAHINRGLANYNLGRYDPALQDFDSVIGLDPNLTTAYIYRGLVNYNLGKYDQAIGDYNKAIELDPRQAVAYYNIARIYSLKDNHEKAIQYLGMAIQINPDIKNMAKKENDFNRISQQPEFIKMIGP
jgi:tetratricopeptide (TPR) repeat protein